VNGKVFRLGGNIVPSERISESLIWSSGNIGRGARRGEPRDPRRVLSSNVDGRVGADREAQGARVSRGEQRVSSEERLVTDSEGEGSGKLVVTTSISKHEFFCSARSGFVLEGEQRRFNWFSAALQAPATYVSSCCPVEGLSTVSDWLLTSAPSFRQTILFRTILARLEVLQTAAIVVGEPGTGEEGEDISDSD
jgi:hypothetical protein